MINKTKTRPELYKEAILKSDIRWQINTIERTLELLQEIDLGTETRNAAIEQLSSNVAKLKKLLNKESS